VKLWRWFLELIGSDPATPEPTDQAPFCTMVQNATPPTQPALWLRSDAAPVLDELTARQLRGRADEGTEP